MSGSPNNGTVVIGGVYAVMWVVERRRKKMQGEMSTTIDNENRFAMAGSRSPTERLSSHHPLGRHVGLLPRSVSTRRDPFQQLHRHLVEPPGAG